MTTDGAPATHRKEAGIRGMRERALLVGADLSLGPGPEKGTEVRLTVPLPVRDPDRNGRP